MVDGGVRTWTIGWAGALLAMGLLGASPPAGAMPDAPDASAWLLSETPNASDTPTELLGLSCLADDDCWAVGRATGATSFSVTATFHWDGTAWSTVPSPSVANVANVLVDVDCVFADECWAVGFTISPLDVSVAALLLRWDGAAWSLADTSDALGGLEGWNAFNAIDCFAWSCWIVGFDASDGPARSIAAVSGGGDWYAYPPRALPADPNALRGISCVVEASTRCWAVGDSWTADGLRSPFALGVNGLTWGAPAPIASPDPTAGEATLWAIDCAATDSCFAVGSSIGAAGALPLIAQWDGTGWGSSLVPTAAASTFQELLDVVCLTADDCWAVGAASDALTTPSLTDLGLPDPGLGLDGMTVAPGEPIRLSWDGAVWKTGSPYDLPQPTATFGTALAAIDCYASGGCAAAGTTDPLGIHRAYLELLDTTWKEQAAPTVWTPQANFLSGATCVAADDCWASGFHFSGPVARTLTQHWDGDAWAVVPSPNTAVDRNNYLQDVGCLSSDSCWAVGASTDTLGNEGQALFLRWDGQAWSGVAATPDVDTRDVEDIGLWRVDCVTEDDCWAAGHSATAAGYRAMLWHWDGSDWTQAAAPHKGLPTQDNMLYGLDCVAAYDCKAVGVHWIGTRYETLVMHYNGLLWSVVESPNAGLARDNMLHGVTCTASDDCWAAGRADLAEDDQTLILHWDGSSWSVADVPAEGHFLSHVTCRTADDCWAAGQAYGLGPLPTTFALHWDGQEWSTVATPNRGPVPNTIRGLACSDEDCWMVGEAEQGSVQRTLVLRWSSPSEGCAAGPASRCPDAGRMPTAAQACVPSGKAPHLTDRDADGLPAVYFGGGGPSVGLRVDGKVLRGSWSGSCWSGGDPDDDGGRRGPLLPVDGVQACVPTTSSTVKAIDRDGDGLPALYMTKTRTGLCWLGGDMTDDGQDHGVGGITIG